LRQSRPIAGYFVAHLAVHFPGHQEKVPGDYQPVPRSKAEAEFLGIGAGARTLLLEAAVAGAQRINVKMAEAVALAKIAGTD
jgi:hypothetical protein